VKVGDWMTLQDAFKNHDAYGVNFQIKEIGPWPLHPSAIMTYVVKQGNFSEGPWNATCFRLVDVGGPW